MTEKKKSGGPKKKVDRTALTERTIEHALATGTLKPEQYKLPADHKWNGLWKVFAGIGGVGLAIAGAGYATDPKRFAFSYLFAFMGTLMLAIGAMMFTLIQHVVSAGWSVVVRRVAEFFSAGSVVFVVLFIPIAMSMSTLYPWLHGDEHHETATLAVDHGDARLAQHDAKPADGKATDATHAVPAAHSRPSPEAEEHAEIMHRKTWWLYSSGFLMRAFIYLILWGVMGTLLLRNSVGQDSSRDMKATVSAARLSTLGIPLLALSLTGAAVDWMMSLEPTWYSTIYGVIYFANSIVGALALFNVVFHQMHKVELLKKEVTPEHFHDIGKLMHGFLIFWAYVSFAQYMLIYYASIPEETTFYHHRWAHGGDTWRTISLVIVGVRFVVPFFFVLSRNIKRKPEYLQIGAGIILFMNFVEAYWYVMPYAPNATTAAFTSGIWIDIGCLIGVLSSYLAVVFWNLSRHPLIPVGDPRLARSLRFQNA